MLRGVFFPDVIYEDELTLKTTYFWQLCAKFGGQNYGCVKMWVITQSADSFMFKEAELYFIVM